MSDSKSALIGRTFWHPLLDYTIIGGGLAIFFAGLIYTFADGPNGGLLVDASWVPFIGLVSVATHFGASTVRLYKKPEARDSLPFVTMGLPVATLAVASLCIAMSGTFGYHYQALYLTWAPYHYAAQTYGLSVMYAMRSGAKLDTKMKRWLRGVALLPFIYTFLLGQNEGLGWLLSILGVVDAGSAALEGGAADALRSTLQVATFAAPPLLLALVWRKLGRPLPLIVPTLLVANGLWWIFLPTVQAFFWATVFHSVQYLAIVLIFHVRDQGQSGEKGSPLALGAKFYGLSFLLGYGLFQALPRGYMALGFGEVESVLIVVATVNMHHYIVDAYVWRLHGDRRNRKVVEHAG